MNWDDLRIFLAVARGGTLHAAARQLGIDATTVARRVARLEAATELTLFEHTPAGHVLTPRGQELMAHAQAMEAAAQAANEGAAAGAGHGGGTVRISVSEGFGGWIIAPHLADFAQAHPDIAVELAASTGFLNPSRREADIAIMLARPSSGPLVVRKLTDYHLGLYGMAGTPEPAGPSALKTARLVGYVPDLIYSPALRYIDDIDGGLTAGLTSTSVNAQAMMVRHGAGLGILPCFIGDADPGLVRLLEAEVDIRRAFWLVVHRDVRGIARVKAFVAWLDALIARLQPLLGGSAATIR